MLELHVADTNVTSGSINVSWCLTKEALLKLKELQLQDPYIVLCVAPCGAKYSFWKESRKAVPLRDMIAYLEFFAAGSNKIWGFLVRNKSSASRFLQKNDGHYETHILNDDGTEYRTWHKRQICLIGEIRHDHEGYDHIDDYTTASVAQPISISLPEGCFALEPAKWEKTWVNHFFRNKCVDQCDFRRRRLFAYTLQPLMMIVNVLLRFLIFMFALLFGARKLSPKYLIHPFTYDLSDSFEMFGGGTIFLLRSKYTVINFLTLVLMPYVLAMLFLVYKVKFLSLCFMGLMCGILIAIIISAAKNRGLFVLNWLENKLVGGNNQIFWYTDEEEQNLILCNGQNKPMRLSELPRHHRTIRLRFDDLKSKVCRPFSR